MGNNIMNLDYEQMALLSNTTPKNFLSKSKRYEQSLKIKGWQFTKEGKGKTAIYYVQEELKQKPWEEMTFKERFKKLYDVNLKYPIVMKKYMIALKYNKDNIQTLSDGSASKIIECTRQRINYCRKTLERIDLIIPCKQQKKAKYYIYYDFDRNYEIEEISHKEYAQYWKDYYESLKVEMAEKGIIIKNHIECDKKDLKKIQDRLFLDLHSNAGGYLVKIFEKEPTDSFYDAIDRLIS